MYNRFFVFLIFFLGTLSFLPGQNHWQDLEEALQEQMNKRVTEYQLPGMTLGLVFDQEMVIDLAAGYADIEKKLNMQPGDKMLAGSVGKTYVSAVVLKLVAQGKLDLEAKLGDFFGEETWFAALPNANDIRIRNLMKHSSGLPRYIFQKEFLTDIRNNPLLDLKPEECVAYVLNKPALHDTAKGWAYSDTNYILLGMVIEKLTNQTYYELAEEWILKPLSLKNTRPSNQRQLPGLVQGYIGSQNFLNLPNLIVDDGKLSINPAFEWTGGGMVSNVADLARWAKALHEGEVLTNNTYRELISPISMTSGKPYDQGYGLGTFVWAKQNDTRYGHAGFFPGYLTHLEYSSKHQYAIAIQVNTDEGSSRLQEFIYQFDHIILAHLDDIAEEKILENFKQQEDCWNQKDIDCYMQAYATDEEVQTNSRSGVTYGYDDILNNYKKYFPADSMGELHFDELAMRRLSDQLYFVTGRFNLKAPNQEELRQGWFSVVMKKIKGQWFMITDHSS